MIKLLSTYIIILFLTDVKGELIVHIICRSGKVTCINRVFAFGEGRLLLPYVWVEIESPVRLKKDHLDGGRN